MAPPELQLINQIWNGSRSKLGCIAWFASGVDGWGPLVDRGNLDLSEPEICEGKMMAACTHTASCVAKLLSTKSSGNGQLSFDLDWSDVPKDPVLADQVVAVFSQVDKVFLVRVDLSDGTGHSFVVTSYLDSSQTVCCALYMSYATAVGGGGYALSGFLKGNFGFAPKMGRDIPMISFIQTFTTLFKADTSGTEFQKAWQALFGCDPGSFTHLKQVLVKVLDRTVLAQNDILQKLGRQWLNCPHGV